MKSISLYKDNGTWLCRVHPFTKAMYIAAAILIPLLSGSLWAYGAAIALDIIILASGKSLRRARALIIFSFTIIATFYPCISISCDNAPWNDVYDTYMIRARFQRKLGFREILHIHPS